MATHGKKKSGTAKKSAPKSRPPAGPADARQKAESDSAKNAQETIRERMVRIGRGNKQAGRQ